MSIEELQKLRDAFNNKCIELSAQLLDVPSNSDEFDKLSERISQLQQQRQFFDEQIDRLKREQLPALAESLTGLTPPASAPGGSTTNNIFLNAQLGATNFGPDNQGSMIGNQDNRDPAPSAPQTFSPLPAPQEPATVENCDIPAHLLFSVFKSRNFPSDRVRIVAELHFYDSQTKKIEIEAIDLPPAPNADGCDDVEQTYEVSSLARCLSQASDRSVVRLAQLRQSERFRGICEPIVEIFLPTERLGYSLKDCCSEYPQLPQRYTVVVRSSDRLEGPPRDVAYYKSRLEAAWQRFFPTERDNFPHIPNTPRLETLSWLESSDTCREDFEEYAGIQCFGHWLTPESDYWSQLIEAGTPLAFWLYDCDIPCEIASDERRQIFQRLVKGDRFGLLSELRRERRQSCAAGLAADGYHLGVFYEDVNYCPTIDEDWNWPS